jgi:hypothetical protein
MIIKSLIVTIQANSRWDQWGNLKVATRFATPLRPPTVKA